jgi:Ca2+-binding RTX toxin-like protein
VFNQQLSNADYTEILAANKTATELNAWANSAVASEFRNKTTAQVAETLLTNVGLSTVAGLENWVTGQLNAGGGIAKAGETILAMLNDFSNMTADATYGAAAMTFNQKASNSQALSQTAGTQTGTYAAVSSSAPSASITLTASVDNRVGGTGSDSFSGLVDGSTATNTSLNAGDNLDGSGGNDTLLITAQGTGGTITGVTTNNVETIQVQSVQSTNTTVYDALLGTGITNVAVIGSSNPVSFTNLPSIPALAVNSNNASVTVGFRSSATTAGTADSMSISLNGNSTTTAQTITANAIETFNVASSGTASGASTRAVTLASTTLKNINVTGNAGVTAVATLSGATVVGTPGVVDASASTATSLSLNITAGSNNQTSITGSAGNDTLIVTPGSTGEFTVTGGAGNDTVRVDGSTLVSSKTIISGGDGTDTLQLSGTTNFTSSAAAAAVTGFETVDAFQSVTTAGTTAALARAFTQDVSLLSTAPTKVQISAWGLTGQNTTNATNITSSVTFNGLTATTTDLSISGMSVSTVAPAAGATAGANTTDAVTVAVGMLADGVNDSLNVTLGSATAGALTVTTSSTAGAGGAAAGTAAGSLNLNVAPIENVTITSNAASSATTNTITTLTAGSMKTLTIGAGNAPLTISGSAAAHSALNSINASAATQDLNINSMSLAARAITITGGSGNDTFSGTTVSDSLDGGAGADAITGGGGNDNITGGLGNDTITAGSGNDVINGGDGDDLITGAGGNDNINGGAGNDVINATVSAANTVNFASTTTINGGDGTDVIRVTGTATGGAVALNFSPSSETRFTNVSNIEAIEIGSLLVGTTEQTVGIQLGDIALGSFGNNIAIRTQAGFTAGAAQTIDASATLNTSSKVTYTGSNTGNTYIVGNNIDAVTLGTGGDTVTVSNPLFLQATDSISAGLGADTLSVTSASSTSVAFTTATLANVSGFETLNANFATGTTGGLSFTLSDAFASNNRDAATNALTVSVTEGTGTGALTVNGSAVTGSGLIINSSTRADTLTGGTGNDVFIAAASTTLNGESITGGDGTDVVRFTGTTNSLNGVTLSGIEGFQFGLNGVATVSMLASALTGQTFTVAEVDAVNNVNVIALTANGLATIDLSKITTAAATDGSTFATNDSLTIDFTGTADVNLSHNFTGSGLADTVTLGASAIADTVTGGAGADIFIVAAGSTLANVITNSAFIDNISGGAGTDTLRITGTTLQTIANTVSWANLSSIDTLEFSGAYTGVISVTPAATAWTQGLRKIDLTLDSSATAINVIDARSNTTATIGLTMIGAGGVDQIFGGAGNDTITGGAGIDQIAASATGDTLVYSALTDSASGATGIALVSGTTVVNAAGTNVGLDVITFASTPATGNTLVFDFSAFNSATYTAAAVTVGTTGSGLSGTAGVVSVIVGTTGAADGVFTVGGTATTSIIQVDTDGATAAGIVSIGVVGVVVSAALSATGILTLTF